MPMYKKIISAFIAFFAIFSLTFNVYAVSDCDVSAKADKKIDENLYISEFIDGSAIIHTLGESTISVNNDKIDNNKKLVVTEIVKDDDAYSWINHIMAGTDFVCYDIQIYDSENMQCFVNSDLNFLFLNPQLNNKNIELFFINADGIKEKITTNITDKKISFTSSKQGVYVMGYTNDDPSEPDVKSTEPNMEPNNPKEEATQVAKATKPFQQVSDEEATKGNAAVDSSGKPVNSGQDFCYYIYLLIILLSMIIFIAFNRKNSD